MTLSVRSRLALAFGAIAALGLVVVALVTPGIVRNTLEDDLLRAEAESIDATLSFVFDADEFDGLVVETGELVGTDLGQLGTDPTIAEVFAADIGDTGFEVTERDSYLALQVSLLRQTGRLDDIVEAAGGPFVLALDGEIAVLVDTDGTIVELLPSTADAIDPVLASDELDQYLFDDLGFVAIDGETLVQIEESPVLLRTVDHAGVDYVVAVDATPVENSVDRTQRFLWIGVPIAAVVAALLAWALTSRALRPVAAITDRASTITSGTLDARVPVPSTDDEIADLASTVNDMLDRIDTDDRRRRRFVSDASHELRTPVAVMRNEAEVALEHPDRSDVTELAEAVADESRRLSDIIDDLLALARHDEGAGVDLVDVDLDDVVLDEAARTRRVPVATRQISAGRVRGVPGDLSRLVGHLLDNAARHASHTVEVGVRTDADRVVLTVDDDGPGVPSERRDAVFERFARLDDARTRDGGGAGLGLAVVREIAARSGGEVHVEDGPLGGARFVVTFPTT